MGITLDIIFILRTISIATRAKQELNYNILTMSHFSNSAVRIAIRLHRQGSKVVYVMAKCRKCGS